MNFHEYSAVREGRGSCPKSCSNKVSHTALLRAVNMILTTFYPTKIPQYKFVGFHLSTFIVLGTGCTHLLLASVI